MVDVTIKPGVPNKLRNGLDLRAIMTQELDNGAEELLRRYKKTTATWDHQPDFYIISTAFTRSIRTQDKIFIYVDRGTPAHTIPAGNIGFLQFRQGYRAKTTPRVISSKKGGEYGKYVRKDIVQHPGIQPREFSETIQEEVTPRIVASIEKKIASAIRRTR